MECISEEMLQRRYRKLREKKASANNKGTSGEKAKEQTENTKLNRNVRRIVKADKRNYKDTW
ncbi:hypothetical protein DPMN_008700 [Dreissena polymorpha]|uniref:Uncharacterized protein n=1 Tax=Dreissena polymorpha TaxID=45954 RepID=A0A9D4RXL3_DREPO|nr:hypothetical protein DPMN_008700 [Dreissena polymorpha]